MVHTIVLKEYKKINNLSNFHVVRTKRKLNEVKYQMKNQAENYYQFNYANQCTNTFW